MKVGNLVQSSDGGTRILYQELSHKPSGKLFAGEIGLVLQVNDDYEHDGTRLCVLTPRGTVGWRGIDAFKVISET